MISEEAREARNKHMREYMRKYRAKPENARRRREQDRLNYANHPEKWQKRQADYWQRKAEAEKKEEGRTT